MRGVISAMALSALTVFVAASCKEQKVEKVQAQPPAVVVVAAVKTAVSPVADYVGQTKAQDTVDLRARVEGFLTLRNFTEGQMVKSGDLLYQIEKDQYEAYVESSQGALDSAKAKCTDAQVTFKRQDTLWQQGVNAQKDYDNALYAKLSAEATVAECDANLKQAKINLGYTDIRAPFDGCVGLSTYSVGNLVGSSSEKLATIVRIDPMRVEFNINELDVLKYNLSIAGTSSQDAMPGHDLVIRLQFQNGSAFQGEGFLAYMDNHINTSTGTLLVQAEFKNPKSVLVPGMYVKVLVSKRAKREEILIPAKAVLANQSGSYVFVVGKDSKACIRQIVKGESFGQLVEVVSGLAEGESVVTDGLQKMRDGIEVAPKLDKLDTASAGV